MEVSSFEVGLAEKVRPYKIRPRGSYDSDIANRYELQILRQLEFCSEKATTRELLLAAYYNSSSLQTPGSGGIGERRCYVGRDSNRWWRRRGQTTRRDNKRGSQGHTAAFSATSDGLRGSVNPCKASEHYGCVDDGRALAKNPFRYAGGVQRAKFLSRCASNLRTVTH